MEFFVKFWYNHFVIWAADVVVISGAQILSFGMLVVSTLAPLGTIRATQRHLGAQEEEPRGPGFDFYERGANLGSVF